MSATARPSRTDAEWLRGLEASGDEQADAVSELRQYLLRASLFALRRCRASLAHLAAPDLDALAEDCAQEAVMAVLAQLKTFRGDSRFTTWAYRFAINTALVAARREGGRRVPLDALLDAAGGGPRLDEPPPDQEALRAEIRTLIREAIDRDLSERQRQALTAVLFEGVPLETAAPWDSGFLVDRGATFETTLSVPGVYDYFCLPHEVAGMVGRIVVRQAIGPGALAFDYFTGRSGAADWLPVPDAARRAFPPIQRILRDRIVRAG